MKYFPFFFNIQKKPVLIVGGGAIAQRKVELLLRSGCALRVVAATITPALSALLQLHQAKTEVRRYRTDDINNCTLVVCATDDSSLNQRVSEDCRRAGIPINVVDCPALSDFIFPALIDRSPLVVAVSTAGASPVLARRVREKIETALPMTLGKLAEFCDRFRQKVKQTLPATRRRLFWEQVLDGNIGESILTGQSTDATAAQQLQKHLQQFADDDSDNGQVYLIGAGPGAADLLTFRALRLLQQADVVVHDRLVSADVLSLARRDAEKIFVGKQRNQQMASQEEINQLLIDLARKNLRVARLKGGDPFIFGRGGEELSALHAAGIPTQVVPGITAAAGCAAALQMPLTTRNIARSVRLVTVYQRDMHNDNFWSELAYEHDTTQVFYMAGVMVDFICQRLIAAGVADDKPALLVCGGTTAAQQHFCGTLATLPQIIEGRWFSPALLIIGDVAALARADNEAQETRNAIKQPFITLQEEFADVIPTAVAHY